MTEIKIEFQGKVNDFEDRKNAYLKSRTPQGTEFRGRFQFEDTRNLWPKPGDYTTSNCIFRIDFANGFTKANDFSIQTNVLDKNSKNQLWLYGETAVIEDEQWTFGIGFYFKADETSGNIEWDFSEQQHVSLDVSLGGHSEGGPPESVNSVMRGRAHKIEKVAIFSPTGLRISRG